MAGRETHIYDTIEDVNQNQWNTLVEQADEGSLFHTYEWLAAIEHGIGYQPRHVVVAKGGNPVGICPNFVTELEMPSRVRDFPLAERFVELTSIEPGFGGFVIAGSKESVFESLFDGIEAACDDSAVTHRLRVDSLAYLGYAYPLAKLGYKSTITTCRFVLDLNRTWSRVKEGFSNARRRDLRNAENDSITVRESPLTERTLERFYPAYEETMARVGGAPFPRAFFARLWSTLGDSVKLFVAERDSEVVGEHLYLLDHHQDTIHYLFAAVTEENLRHSPSVPIHGHALRWGIDSPFDRYDFGDTSADFKSGIFSFKSQFGGDVVPTIAWQKGYAPVRWFVYRLARYAYRRHGETMAAAVKRVTSSGITRGL